MIELFIFLVVLGVIVWAVTTFIPMPPQFKTLITVVAVIIALLYILNAFGVLHGSVGVPKLR